MTSLPYNPTLLSLTPQRAKDRRVVWAISVSLAATKEMLFLRTLFYFPPGTEMFYFPGCTLYVIRRATTYSR